MNRFCTNCGCQLEEEKFCPKCGTKVENIQGYSQAVNIQQKTNGEKTDNYDTNVQGSKETTIKELQRLKQYFKQKDNDYKRRNYLINQLNNSEKPSRFAWFLGGGFLGFLVGLILVGLSPDWLYWLTDDSAWSVLFWFIPWAAITIGGYRKSRKKFNDNVNNMKQELSTLATNLQTHYSHASDCIIAFEYSEPAIIQKIIDLLNTGRADTLKESINIMLDDIHKQAIYAQQAELVKSSKNTANAADTASLLVGISLLNRKS